ncbi:hypothetical protein GCM10010833_32200 [Blastomonas aquatica]|uniref:RNA polymerase sigma-70 region 2 domain-containing protein n=1 Tax=Blastomonas aquatica TaxID=1510276 RepID=A0ABQ1JQW1_9SPHN|nr:hypothetical protein GCM10010833_32200 [Blastomonas aquatica]
MSRYHEDAEQVCAIAIHRAIGAYDPAKAKFTTFLNWQIRGELQSLRFRLMTDHRPSARKVDAVTIPIHAGTINGDGEETTLESLIQDHGALERTECGASDFLASDTFRAVVDAYIEMERKAGLEQLRKRARTRRPSPERREARPDLPVGYRGHQGVEPEELASLGQRLERDRAIIERSLFSDDTRAALSIDTSLTHERIRQIMRRASKQMASLVLTDPRFAMFAEQVTTKATAATDVQAPPRIPATILPAMHQQHNEMVQVSAPKTSAAVPPAAGPRSVNPPRATSGAALSA